MGTNESLKHIASDRVKVEATDNGYRVSGDTYPVKEYLKREYGAKWNKEAKAWEIAIMDCYSDGRNSVHYQPLQDKC